jgi:hypothetical protein
MDAAAHQQQVEQLITRAWQHYVSACLEHQRDSATLAMAEVDRLLDLPAIPRQRLTA